VDIRRTRNVLNAFRNMGAVTHSEEVLVASHHSGLDAVRRVAGICSKFRFGAVHLYDLLAKRPVGSSKLPRWIAPAASFAFRGKDPKIGV